MKRVMPALALLATLAGLAGAQPAPVPAAAVERPVSTNGPGPRKLAVDLALLSGSRPSRSGRGPSSRSSPRDRLADLRFFDQSGQEIAYLLIPAPPKRDAWVSGVILATARTAKISGFEVDLGRAGPVDAIAVDDLPPPFMKRLLLEGSGDRARWTVLAAQASLFDLPQERVRQTAVEFRPGSYRYLRVTWDDTNSAPVRLPGRARARAAGGRPEPVPPLAGVPIVRQAGEPGRSRYQVTLPSTSLPVVALRLHGGSGDVFRTAVVAEPRFNGVRVDPVELGRSRLVRTARGDGAPAPLRVAIEPPEGRELQLVIEDGSNAPLEIERAEIELAELPWIYFDAPRQPLTARYGTGVERAPQYDLEAKRGAIRLDEVAEAAWGEPRQAGAPRETAPAPPFPERGARLDIVGFEYQRELVEGTPGLVALPLDAAVLAHSRSVAGGFADVRIVDEGGNQIPYLLERRDEKLAIDLALAPAVPAAPALGDRAATRSFYAIGLPYGGLPDARLLIETSDRVFRRPIQLGVQRPPDRRRRDVSFEPLADAVWQHMDASAPAPALELAVRSDVSQELLLIVDEGDNRPLPVTSVRLLLPSWRLRFFRPAGTLRLVYGQAQTAAPQYDLALLAPAVMAAEAREIVATPERAAPPAAPLVSPLLFYVGLGIAVLVLLGLIVRLISSGTEPPGPPAP